MELFSASWIILCLNEAFRLFYLYEYENISTVIFDSFLFIRLHRIHITIWINRCTLDLATDAITTKPYILQKSKGYRDRYWTNSTVSIHMFRRTWNTTVGAFTSISWYTWNSSENRQNKRNKRTELINRSSRRKRGMASNPLFIVPAFFFAFSQWTLLWQP